MKRGRGEARRGEARRGEGQPRVELTPENCLQEDCHEGGLSFPKTALRVTWIFALQFESALRKDLLLKLQIPDVRSYIDHSPPFQDART